MSTVPLPPWLRKWQQSWYWQNLLLPLLSGFGGSLALQGCLTDIFNIPTSCLHAAANGFIIATFTAWVKGHSAGSSDFKNDGTPLTAAPKLKELADMQAKVSDPASPVTQADATQAAQTVARVDAVVSNVLASTEAKKP